MLRRITLAVLPLLLLVAAAIPASATQRLSGFCTVGGQSVNTQGLSSTSLVQSSYPGCTVTVYQTGTLTLATLYADSIGTPLSNPFTASTLTGAWGFYVATGAYDIALSGGSNGGFPSPFTISGAWAFDPAIPGGIGGTTPAPGSFTTLTTTGAFTPAIQSIDGSTLGAYNTTPLIAQNPSFRNLMSLTRTQITNNSLTNPFLDAVIVAQQCTVSSGQTWQTMCPAGGTNPLNQFNITMQLESVIADSAALNTAIDSLVQLCGNISSAPTNIRNINICHEIDFITHQDYGLGWDLDGTVPGSEFWSSDVLLTNIQNGIAGVALTAKSNFWSGGKQNWPKWSANAPGFQNGAPVVPSAAGSNPPYWYQIIVPASYANNANCTTGNVEPSWPTTPGTTFTDGTCTWKTYANTGQGLWQFGYDAHDWLAGGFRSVINNPYSTGNAYVAWSNNTAYPANFLFAQGTQSQMNAGAACQYVMGIGGGSYAGNWGLYNGCGASIQQLYFLANGTTYLNSGTGKTYFGARGGTPVVYIDPVAANPDRLTLDTAVAGQIRSIFYSDLGVPKWSMGADASNNFSIYDAVSAKQRISANAPSGGNASTYIDATGSGAIYLNQRSGTGGVIVNPTGSASIDGSGNGAFQNLAMNHLNQSVSRNFAGQCTMAAGTTCTWTLVTSYTGTPMCFAQAPTTTILGYCAVSGTTVTVTAASANSLVWSAMVVGNPN